MKTLYLPFAKVLFSLFLMMICSSLYCQERSSHSNDRNQDVIQRLNEMDSYWEEQLEGKDPDGSGLSVSSSIKSARISYWGLTIAFCSALIALFGAIVTCGTFILQFRLGRRQKKDISDERHENRLFGYIQQYHNIVNAFEFGAVGHGRPVFNYLFYEYQMLMQEFGKLGITTLTGAPIDKYLLSSICISFIINGVTDNADAGEMDLIYKHYRDVLSLEDYERMKAVILKYRDISNKELSVVLKATPYTLLVNYAPLQLEEKKNVRWFYGCRAFFMPYVKTVECMLEFTREKNSANPKEDMRIIGSAFSDHELGILSAFALSRENEYEKNKYHVDAQLMEKFIATSGLPKLYDFRQWQ